jgi:hypothetical protein
VQPRAHHLGVYGRSLHLSSLYKWSKDEGETTGAKLAARARNAPKKITESLIRESKGVGHATKSNSNIIIEKTIGQDKLGKGTRERVQNACILAGNKVG